MFYLILQIYHIIHLNSGLWFKYYFISIMILPAHTIRHYFGYLIEFKCNTCLGYIVPIQLLLTRVTVHDKLDTVNVCIVLYQKIAIFSWPTMC